MTRVAKRLTGTDSSPSPFIIISASEQGIYEAAAAVTMFAFNLLELWDHLLPVEEGQSGWANVRFYHLSSAFLANMVNIAKLHQHNENSEQVNKIKHILMKTWTTYQEITA